ncbi:hypothetical protein [Komagataeibacter europaeus]|mgnify:CR=1 FL=1|uniref:Uncharacterized protein n=1 Tax=Komagataeibacter europaeus NBRC 3261 TaxID=1234669 RepID=A0A0D6PYA2_KOMEU|nr:hypothetical protein [Komagataeibacter europaeus]GAN96023.1 hypothetical protein Geu3261_0045_025 [Komagataeibacter europaeus NBRC 3261]GBQ43772.1 hypothetical protein AA18890_2042 [Komagataeibacter europaeus LMG 18890]
MHNLDFSSWHSLLATAIGLSLITLIGVGIRLLVMVVVQQRRERMNRQINERLRTLIAAYRTLGGSFTGDLAVDPRHRRELRVMENGDMQASVRPDEGTDTAGSDRARRIRDAVEAALSDIILLGTEEHVRLADHAARELVTGQRVHTHDLVVSLRDFIRKALDLEPIPSDLSLPMQGPARAQASGNRGKEEGKKEGAGGNAGGGGGGMQAGGDMTVTGENHIDGHGNISQH